MTTVLTDCSLRHLMDEGYSLSTILDGSELATNEITVEQIGGITYVLHREDTRERRRLVLAYENAERALPSELEVQERPVMERLRAFFERAKATPIHLPHNWGQYKHDDLVSFFVCGRDRLPDAPRWIAQVLPQSGDVCIWKLARTSEQMALEELVPNDRAYQDVVDNWDAAISATSLHFAGIQPALQHAGDLDLVDVEFSDVTQDLLYSGWLEKVTAQQMAFIERAPDHSIRLRGPAGSGKTLTLELKAIREVQAARQRGEVLRTLFVTHSWVLAGEVDANIERLSEWGRLDEITVLPLLAVAELLLPPERSDAELQLIGEDSLSGKTAQLEQISNVIEHFIAGDWLTFREEVSPSLRDRLEAEDPAELRAFVWDCLIEFGCVLGADGIYPGVNAESRYLRLSRAPWMMPLESAADKRLVLYLYETYLRQLLTEGRLTPDQLVNDFLNYLETYIWNVRRGRQGYDQIFVDEFHLFNIQERQLLRYLARTGSQYPRIFMALDPRQSPWEIYTGMGDTSPSSVPSKSEDGFGVVSSVDLPTVHRFSPEILALVKHLHWDFPNLDLGADWDIDFANVTSDAASGPIPKLVHSGSQAAEIVEIYKALRDLRSGDTSRWHLAVAVVDPDRFPAYKSVADGLAQTAKTKVTIIESREDIEVLQYRRRGIVIGPAEYLAGLQFDAVLIAGLPHLSSGHANLGYRRRRYLSLLYLAMTRASREVRIFVNNDHGGIPEVLAKARSQHLVNVVQGALV